MSPQEMDQLVRRANQAGFDSIADYAANLEEALKQCVRTQCHGAAGYAAWDHAQRLVGKAA